MTSVLEVFSQTCVCWHELQTRWLLWRFPYLRINTNTHAGFSLCIHFWKALKRVGFYCGETEGETTSESEGLVRSNRRGWMDERAPKGRGGGGKEKSVRLCPGGELPLSNWSNKSGMWRHRRRLPHQDTSHPHFAGRENQLKEAGSQHKPAATSCRAELRAAKTHVQAALFVRKMPKKKQIGLNRFAGRFNVLTRCSVFIFPAARRPRPPQFTAKWFQLRVR